MECHRFLVNVTFKKMEWGFKFFLLLDLLQRGFDPLLSRDLFFPIGQALC